MAKKGRHRKGGGRVTPKGTRPAGFRPRHHEGSEWDEPEPEAELVRTVRGAMRDDHPLQLLELASAMLSLLDDRDVDPFGDREESTSRHDIVQSLIDADRPETTALVATIAALSTDEVERTRIRHAVASRSDLLPTWLSTIDDAHVTGAVEMVHVLGDGDNVVVGVHLPSGHDLSAVVYIDHNVGTLVKDAYLVPQPLTDLIALMQRTVDDPDTRFDDLPLADARTRITDAIERAAITYPPFTSESWPSCRAVVEWIVEMLPRGGHGYERPEWTDDQRTALVDRFFASAFSSREDADRRGLVDDFIWFGCDYGPGDPLRWSPVAVEIILADWIPRKIVADVSYLEQAPQLLGEFVRFCHHERSIPSYLTDETLEAIDRWEPEYQDVIRSDRPQGPAAILAKMGLDPWSERDDDPSSLMRHVLEETVGGPEVLDSLDDHPLPDEPFDWSHVGDDVRGRVAEVVALIDRCCEELFDIEHRTAARRMLARITERGVDVLRRGRSDTAAAAICISVASANRSFDYRRGGLKVKDVLAHFGLTNSVAARESRLLDAGDFPRDTLDFGLGSPAYLTGARRAGIIETRDRWAAM
jgi:hypothetical protein